ncbi:putative (R)-specific enoyl-CoA hydratase [Minicystis rosea]|nr:putative (R)-specific enoyl-CoA hydratase [Minicystis rosea]
MAFDLSTVGYTTQPIPFSFDWKKLAVYALGIGAKRDELDFLYENIKGGMKAYPTFAVIAAQAPVFELLGKCNANMAMVVHGGQVVRVHRSIPAEGNLETTGTIKGIYDMKKFGQVVLETNTKLDGEPLFDTTWSIIVRDGGGFSGPRPPSGGDEPSVPKDRAPDFTVEEATSPEQALLYRVSGDVNPLHADPEFATAVGFPQGPILHGLCTYGFAARAVIKHMAGGDPSRLKTFAAQFRKPVWPGDTLVTQGWDVGGGKIAVVTTVKGRPDPVLTNAWAQIA